MSFKYKVILLISSFILFTICSSCSTVSIETNIKESKKYTEYPKIEGNRIAPGLKDNNKIKQTESDSDKKKETSNLTGSIKTSFGTFNYKWNIDTKGIAHLTSLESAGSGELPAKEKKIFIKFINDRTTELYQEWFPLLNEKKPVTLKYTAEVPSSKLFSAFPDVNLQTESIESNSDQIIQPVSWGKIYQHNNTLYLPSNIKTSTGMLNIAWEKKTNKFPELIAFDKNKKEKNTLKIFILNNEKNNTSMLFIEKMLQSKNGTIPYLSYLITVKTDELITGFKSIL
ncbi:MAG: hypothetical protein V1874_13045 [Spirochaetota bacterium]